MSDPFIAEIKIFAGNFAPQGYAFCDGQLVAVAQNTALFALVGTTYGGDGRNNFGIPNLMGRAPMHAGNGPGLSQRRLGNLGGTETEPLNAAQLPLHSHSVAATVSPGSDVNPAANILARSQGGAAYATGAADAMLAPDSLAPTGGAEPHNNRQPYLGMNFIIALTGVFPSS